jgi:hemin uptake protein HemP
MSVAAEKESSVVTNANPADPEARPANLPRLRSSDLLGGAREAIIEHGQDLYRLRLTSNGKLILTK